MSGQLTNYRDQCTHDSDQCTNESNVVNTVIFQAPTINEHEIFESSFMNN